MKHVFKISFIILFVSSLAGCFFGHSYYTRIAENVRKLEWFDYNNTEPRSVEYEVRVEGDWYEATLKTEHTPEPGVYKREHFELTPNAKQRLRNKHRGDSGGDSGW